MVFGEQDNDVNQGKELVFWRGWGRRRGAIKTRNTDRQQQNSNRYFSKGASEKRVGLKASSGSFLIYFYNLPLTLFSPCPQLFGVSIVPIFVSSSICACNLMTSVSHLILVCQCHPGLIYSLFSTDCHLDECLPHLFFPSALFFPSCLWPGALVAAVPPVTFQQIRAKRCRRALFVCYLHLNSLSAYGVVSPPPPHY